MYIYNYIYTYYIIYISLYSANLWCGIGPPRHDIEDPPKSDRVGKKMAMTPTSN
jgi:hypothetical protein